MRINTRKNNRAFPFSLLLLILSISLLPLLVSTALASDTDTNTLKIQQQKLQNILDKVGEGQDQRGQQKTMLDKLDQQMECNWELIRGYDACEESHQNNLRKHLDCKQKAQESAVECLSRIKTQED